jgi:hypothetical protein
MGGNKGCEQDIRQSAVGMHRAALLKSSCLGRDGCGRNEKFDSGADARSFSIWSGNP